MMVNIEIETNANKISNLFDLFDSLREEIKPYLYVSSNDVAAKMDDQTPCHNIHKATWFELGSFWWSCLSRPSNRPSPSLSWRSRRPQRSVERPAYRNWRPALAWHCRSAWSVDRWPHRWLVRNSDWSLCCWLEWPGRWRLLWRREKKLWVKIIRSSEIEVNDTIKINTYLEVFDCLARRRSGCSDCSEGRC